MTKGEALATLSAFIEMEISGWGAFCRSLDVVVMPGSIVCFFSPVSGCRAAIPWDCPRKVQAPCGTCVVSVSVLGQLLDFLWSDMNPGVPALLFCCHCCPAKGKFSELVEILQLKAASICLQILLPDSVAVYSQSCKR